MTAGDLMDDDQDRSDVLTNQVAIGRFAWIFGGVMAISLSFPPILFAAAISTILGFCAGVIATVALFAREPIWGEQLTRWDVAAALYALSLFTGFFIDVDSIQAYLQIVRTSAG